MANNWALHQWGNSERGFLGQILKTVELTSHENPSVVVFGTGASKRDGLKESEYTIRYMFDHFYEANKFSQFNGIDLNELKTIMGEKSIPETESQNTLDELKKAGEIFLYKGVERIILVSNPDHISRCMQLAHTVYREPQYSSIKQIFGAQSDAGYKGTSDITSKIIEMPHRGDDPSPDLSKYIGNYFKLPLQSKVEFVDLIKNYFETKIKS